MFCFSVRLHFAFDVLTVLRPHIATKTRTPPAVWPSPAGCRAHQRRFYAYDVQGSAGYGLRMAALLHGPDGSGRATAAAAAAAALGIHLVAYSCRELKVRAVCLTYASPRVRGRGQGLVGISSGAATLACPKP